MIWESCYWKDHLIDLVKRIEYWEYTKYLSEVDLVKIEQQLMIAFYSIRKLIEAEKLSNQVVETTISAKSFKNLEDVTLLNWYHIDRLYDLKHYENIKLPLRFVANQMIHSYVFIAEINDEGGLGGIFFCSDRKRNEVLFYVSSKEFKRVRSYAVDF